MRFFFLSAAVALALAGAANGQNLAPGTPVWANVVSSCGSASYSAGQPYSLTQDTTGKFCDSGGSGGGTVAISQATPGTTNGVQTLSGSVTQVTPSTGATIRTNGTITTGNTFQSVLAANTARKGCRITNTSANAMTLDLGASPAAATAIPLAAGAAFLCGTGDGFVISDQINLTSGTAGSTFVVWAQ